MPVEKSGRTSSTSSTATTSAQHIEQFDPAFSKVLVRYNPDGDTEMNARQIERLKRLADWLHENDRKFLFELLVPAEDHQLEQVGGDTDRYDAELRPELMRRAIEEAQDYGIEVDIWKIEGVDTREDCEMLAQQTRREGREGVVCVLLGRGASDEKVDHWLRQAAPVDGFVGFAIGRSIWWDALKGSSTAARARAAAEQIADNYLRFVEVYREAEVGARRRGGGWPSRAGYLGFCSAAIQASAWNIRTLATTVVARIVRQSRTKRIVPAFCTRSTRRTRERCTARRRSALPAHYRVGRPLAELSLDLRNEALTHPHSSEERNRA